MLKDIQEKLKNRPVVTLWAQGGDYYDVEGMFNLASGYPAVIGLSVNKNKYAYLKGSYSRANVEDFVNKLLSGKEPTYNIPQTITIKKVTEWDGNDQKPPVHNEY